jgi:Peptidase C13 family
MNPILILSDFMQAASFASAVVLLVLQLRAFRRHRHVSFALLSASTVGALLYFAIWEIMGLLTYKVLPTPIWLYLCATAFLLFQIIFGMWGTISLFKSYRRLRETVPESAIRTLHANGAPNTAVLEASSASTPPVNLKPTAFQRLIDVSRLWLLKSSRNTSTLATEAWIVTLAVLTLCLWLALDRLRAGPNATFMSWNIPALGSCVLLALGTAFIAARTSAPRIPFRVALYLVTAAAPLLIAAWWLANTRIGSAFPLLALLLGIYAFAYVALNLRRLTGTWQVRATILLLVAFGLSYAADQRTYWSASVWMPAPTGDEEDYDRSHRKAESLLFDQRSKIDAVVQRFDASPDETPKVFFVGFAGVASQRVFAEEIKLGAKIVGARFNVKDRQLLLLNDRRDLTTFPLATVTSLAYGLKQIGQQMNPDRDILFLAFSSHGSSDPELSVSNAALDLQRLTGEELSSALQASGIKRRVIVISACHAGAFIPPLKNPDTIIITAAAADKTSFGCSDDRDLTYFGEAFYRDALPKAQTLQDAFKQAKEAIALRETQEHQKASDPQAYFGSDLERVLAENPMSPPSVR